MYRMVEAFIAKSGKINPEYFGWGGNTGNMFNYIENHTEHFISMKAFISHSISRLETDAMTENVNAAYITWSLPITKFVPNAGNPDARIFCYARGTAFKIVIESVRGEFTKKLLNLLPKIQ